MRFRDANIMAVVNIHTVLATPRLKLYPAHAFSNRIIARVLRDRYADLIVPTMLQGRKRLRERQPSLH